MSTLTAVLNAHRVCPAEVSLWGGRCYGSLIIHRVWNQGPQSYLAANTCWDAISDGGPQCFQTLPGSSHLYWGEVGEEVVEIT